MKYEDPLIDETHVGNVNVSSEPPLKTFVKLLAALVVVCVVAYASLNVVIYQVVQRISFATEEKYFTPLAETMLMGVDDEKYAEQTQTLQKIADKLRDDALARNSDHPLKDINITIHYSDDATINAFALPAGHIVVMRGLIEAMPNENMLAMVIGHEIAHVVYRDSLTRLGRVALTNMVLLALFGGDSSALGQATLFMESGYSRDAESRADKLGVELLNNSYGHAYGAAELFSVFSRITPEQSRWIELSSSHPLPFKRRQAVEKIIQQRGYSVSPHNEQPMPVHLP